MTFEVSTRWDLFESVPVPLMICARGGAVRASNAALRDLLGPTAVVGTSCWEWFHADDPRLSLATHVERALDASPDGVEIDAVTQLVGGAAIASQLLIRVVDDELAIVVRPLDAEIRQATKLKASQERFETLASNVPAGILSSQAGMRVDYVNQRCCEVFGAAAEVLLGFGWLDYVNAEDAAAAEDAIAEVIASSSEANLPLRIERADGTARWAELRIAAVHSARDIGFVATIEDVTASRELTQELVVQARHDPLTGLPNRVALREMLSRREDRALHGIAVLFVDIDHFKDVNDSLGHSAGDQLLSIVADRLRQCVRTSDAVARFGGDEFVLVVNEVHDTVAVEALAQRVLAAVRAPIDLSGEMAFVSASVGIVHAGAGFEVDVDSLLRDADIAMYQAKRAGRNQLAIFDDHMRKDAQQRMSLHNALRQAIEDADGQIFMEYQPIVSLPDARIRGCEALMRWNLPGGDRIPPTTFIPLAEETGLISALGRLALNDALCALAAWRRHPGAEDLWVSVNLSARDLAEPDLVCAVAAALARVGLPASALRLELTESAVMTDPERAQQVLSHLQLLGISISVDDFGTGHSSLAYLQRLPVDSVKIDRAFIAGLGTDSSATVLVEAIVAMSAALGLSVVAEGVEEADQADRLGAMGAQFAQGYFFSRPVDNARIVERLLTLDGAEAGTVPAYLP